MKDPIEDSVMILCPKCGSYAYKTEELTQRDIEIRIMKALEDIGLSLKTMSGRYRSEF